jgi:fructokinase
VTTHDFPLAVGTGLVALDLVIGNGEERPNRSWAGGTCGNVLAILAFLGWRSIPVARHADDHASRLLCTDLKRWGVSVDFLKSSPSAPTPIVVQVIKHLANGEVRHQFRWKCPSCGRYLPRYQPVTAKGVEELLPQLEHPQVFFMDRLSRGALRLAHWASQLGALVVFEPSEKIEPRLMSEALELVHVLKYSEDRGITENEVGNTSHVLLEIETRGADGLRYRHRKAGADFPEWITLPALTAPRLMDACGSGDWTTAGLIVKTGRAGAPGFSRLSQGEVREAIVYGQALSAWNCCFEGARGCMYHSDRETVDDWVADIMNGAGATNRRLDTIADLSISINVTCPACI